MGETHPVQLNWKTARSLNYVLRWVLSLKKTVFTVGKKGKKMASLIEHTHRYHVGLPEIIRHSSRKASIEDDLKVVA